MLALAFVAFGLALGVDSDGARRVAIQGTPTTLDSATTRVGAARCWAWRRAASCTA